MGDKGSLYTYFNDRGEGVGDRQIRPRRSYERS